jgi:peptidoglycan/xylan/chitin deacetylase (PgdA/CDA1 family)
MQTQRETVLVLGYHDVTSTPDASGFVGPEAASYKLSPRQFTAHLAAIAELGLEPALVADPAQSGESRVFLSFDDAGSSCAETVAPALAARGWRAHFFVVTDLLDTPGFLESAQVRELAHQGHVIGAHGHTHRPLTKLSHSDLEVELRTSKTVLEELLQTPVNTLAAPFGFYARRLDAVVAAAGYRHLFTSEPWLRPRRRQGVTVYGRFALDARTSAADVARLCQFSRYDLVRRKAGWLLRKRARALLGPVYSVARSAVLRRRLRRRIQE